MFCLAPVCDSHKNWRAIGGEARVHAASSSLPSIVGGDGARLDFVSGNGRLPHEGHGREQSSDDECAHGRQDRATR